MRNFFGNSFGFFVIFWGFYWGIFWEFLGFSLGIIWEYAERNFFVCQDFVSMEKEGREEGQEFKLP